MQKYLYPDDILPQIVNEINLPASRIAQIANTLIANNVLHRVPSEHRLFPMESDGQGTDLEAFTCTPQMESVSKGTTLQPGELETELSDVHYLADMCLHSLMGNNKLVLTTPPRHIAEMAYAQAEAMILVREKRSE